MILLGNGNCYHLRICVIVCYVYIGNKLCCFGITRSRGIVIENENDIIIP